MVNSCQTKELDHTGRELSGVCESSNNMYSSGSAAGDFSSAIVKAFHLVKDPHQDGY